MKRLKFLTRKNFQTWLADHHPRTIAGYCNEPERCVVARFVKQNTKKYCDVGAIEIALYSGHKELINTTVEDYHMPEWTKKFIYSMDISRDFHAKPITYGECKRILEGI